MRERLFSRLSLLFDCRVAKTGYRVNGLDISSNRPKTTQLSELFEGQVPAIDAAAMVGHLFTLGDQLTKQFVRACNAYSLAIVAVELDRSLSFLLLVTALECLSTQEEFIPNAELNKSSKSAERYCRLVQSFCGEASGLYPSEGEEALRTDLKTVYHSHRSAFVHGGAEVSIASEVAERAGFNSISHFVDGKEVITPSLKWFFQIARTTLMGFLVNFSRSNESQNSEVLANIASGRAVLTMRVGGA
jgi:Apea-like HEPN